MANLTLRRNETENRLPQVGSWDPFRLMEEMLRWDPFERMGLMNRQVESVQSFVPRFEVNERDDSFVLRADLPGVKKDDVDLSLTGNRLTISGRREHEEEQREEERYYAYERSFGSFSRSLTLPDGVNPEEIEANLANGVLTVVLPKKPEVKPRKISLKERIKGALAS